MPNLLMEGARPGACKLLDWPFHQLRLLLRGAGALLITGVCIYMYLKEIWKIKDMLLQPDWALGLRQELACLRATSRGAPTAVLTPRDCLNFTFHDCDRKQALGASHHPQALLPSLPNKPPTYFSPFGLFWHKSTVMGIQQYRSHPETLKHSQPWLHPVPG